MHLFSKLKKNFFGRWDPKKIFFYNKNISCRGDLTDVSAKTAALVTHVCITDKEVFCYADIPLITVLLVTQSRRIRNMLIPARNFRLANRRSYNLLGSRLRYLTDEKLNSMVKFRLAISIFRRLRTVIKCAGGQEEMTQV